MVKLVDRAGGEGKGLRLRRRRAVGRGRYQQHGPEHIREVNEEDPQVVGEPWKMTQEEYAVGEVSKRELARSPFKIDYTEKDKVEEAVSKGKLVLPGVLKEYPELAVQAGRTAPEAAVVPPEAVAPDITATRRLITAKEELRNLRRGLRDLEQQKAAPRILELQRVAIKEQEATIRKLAAPVPKAVVSLAKESWQMTRGEFLATWKGRGSAEELEAAWHSKVQQAAQQGKPVPKAILQEQEELARKVVIRPEPQAWELTWREWAFNRRIPYDSPYDAKIARKTHGELVKEALSQGKPVPPEVLADYPELAAKVSKEFPVLPEGTLFIPEGFEIERVFPKSNTVRLISRATGERQTAHKLSDGVIRNAQEALKDYPELAAKVPPKMWEHHKGYTYTTKSGKVVRVKAHKEKYR